MMKQKGMDVSKIVMIMNLRFSVPWLSCPGDSELGADLRVKLRMGLGLSVIIVFVYYIILSFTSRLGMVTSIRYLRHGSPISYS